MKGKEPERIPGYAVLSSQRAALMGFAMLWIMLYHAFPLRIPFAPLETVKQYGFAGVDIFLFLSAMGQTLSHLRNPRPYIATVGPRILRVLPVFYLVTVPFYLWKLLTGRIALRSVLFSLSFLGYWLNTPDHFNWYIPALLVFYLLAPLLIRAAGRCGRWADVVTLGIAVLCVALCEWSMRAGFSHLMDFLIRIPVFWIGIRVGFAIHEGRALTRRSCLLWSSLFILGVLYLGLRPLSTYLYLSVPYAFLLTTVPLCLFLAVLLQKRPLRRLSRFLALLGGCSLEIYLINATWFIEFAFFSTLLGLSPARYCLVGIPVNLLLGIGLHRIRSAAQKKLRLRT